uniref:C2H2-type domain-containing protein n=1 Tax=Rhabditophanes sp. KR3021 TaxID=114890 RepID=A0AC35U2Q7_9BILA
MSFRALLYPEALSKLGEHLYECLLKDHLVHVIKPILNPTYDSKIVKGLDYKCNSCKSTFNDGTNLTYHVKKRICLQLRAEVEKTYEKERNMSDVELLAKIIGELKKAKSRSTAKRNQSIYVLVDLLADVDASPVQRKNKSSNHSSEAKLYFRRFIPLNARETKIMNILDKKRQLVAFYLDELTGNEALAFEYGITLDQQAVLTNIDASGQSNDVMFKKHPKNG